jgi:hypothetical protein
MGYELSGHSTVNECADAGREWGASINKYGTDRGGLSPLCQQDLADIGAIIITARPSCRLVCQFRLARRQCMSLPASPTAGRSCDSPAADADQ